MQQTQSHEERTLREFGITECQHPVQIAFDRAELHCPFCGAHFEHGELVGGSVDYKIDFVILNLTREKLKKFVQDGE
jgi:hypothetical protein